MFFYGRLCTCPPRPEQAASDLPKHRRRSPWSTLTRLVRMFSTGTRQIGRLTSSYHRGFTRIPARPLTAVRTLASMSETTKSKYAFVVYAPDCTDPEAYSRRMAVRQHHLDNAKSLKQQGIMSMYAH